MKRKTVSRAVLVVVLGTLMMCGCNSGLFGKNQEPQETVAPTIVQQEEPMTEETGDTDETENIEETGDTVIFDTEVSLAPGPETGEAGEHPYIGQVVDLVNEERAKMGLTPLEKMDRLSMAAAVRAREIVTTFSHTRPDGSAYRTVLDQNGITYNACGENVAYGYRTPEEVVAGWMASEGHRANILNEKYDSIGIGYYKDSNGQAYWVQLFLLKK